MSFDKERKEIIYWAKLLYEKGFITARSGNISYKVAPDKLLVTSHDCYLGHLQEDDILLSDFKGNILEKKGELTSEKELHLQIQKRFGETRVILHTHPPFTTAFFHYFEKLDIFSFEAKFYLGQIKVIPQETPIVTDIKPVVSALENTNLVVLKDHGAVAMGSGFKEAFSLLELLEEQAKVNLTMKSAQGLKRDGSSESRRDEPSGPEGKRYKLMSKEHVSRLIEVVNNDPEAQELGKRYRLTCTLAIKDQDSQDCVRFHYQDGRIEKVDDSPEAEFVIIGKREMLKKVFNREIEPFVAATQGKVKTKGDFSKMGQWYPVLVRTFKLWEEAPVE